MLRCTLLRSAGAHALPKGCGPHVSGGRAIVPGLRASQATCRPWSTQLQPGLDFAPGGMRSQRAHISAMQVRSVWPSFCSKYLHTQELRRRQERCRATPALCALIRSRYLTPSSWSVDISATNSREALPRPPLPSLPRPPLPSAPLPYPLLPAADCFSPPLHGGFL